MKKILPILIIQCMINACLPGYSPTIIPTQTPQVITATPQPLPTATPVSHSPIPPTPTQIQPEGLDRVNIYLVAVGDNGISGKLVGCGDSLVPVEMRIAPTLGVLRAALNELFKLEGQQHYGESGLYNALFQSHLAIENVAVMDGKARIDLSGKLSLGGTCDNPRVEEQLTALALQFSTVTSVQITVNGELLEELLDHQGQIHPIKNRHWLFFLTDSAAF